LKRIEKYLLLLAAMLFLPLVLLMLPLILIFRFGKPKRGVKIGLAVSNGWPYRLQYCRFPYDLAVWRAGAKVVTISPRDLSRLEHILDQVDGLIITGGEDIDPLLYNGQPSAANLINKKRDEMELELLRLSEQRSMPLLCTCRGAQLLAVYKGGSLFNHDDDPQLTKLHSSSLTQLGWHLIDIAPDSLLERITGKRTMTVNSIHHQAMSTTGQMTISAVSRGDHGIEAIESRDFNFALGVQWHPELHAPFNKNQQKLFNALVDAAIARKHS
jgi:putative glutamine amidotransferase